jgi:hypothetical protein
LKEGIYVMENVLTTTQNEIGINFTKFENEWLEILKKDKNYNDAEFFNTYLNESEITLSIFRYRNYLVSKQNDIRNIDKASEIMEYILNENYNLIENKFEEMFLEPVSKVEIRSIINIVTIQEKLIDLIGLHNRKKANRLMSLLTIL